MGCVSCYVQYLEDDCFVVAVELVLLLAVLVHEQLVDCQPYLALRLTQLEAVGGIYHPPLTILISHQFTYYTCTFIYYVQ